MSEIVSMTKESYDEAKRIISEQSSQLAILREALERIAQYHELRGGAYSIPCKIARDALLRAGKGEA